MQIGYSRSPGTARPSAVHSAQLCYPRRLTRRAVSQTRDATPLRLPPRAWLVFFSSEFTCAAAKNYQFALLNQRLSLKVGIYIALIRFPECAYGLAVSRRTLFPP